MKQRTNCPWRAVRTRLLHASAADLHDFTSKCSYTTSITSYSLFYLRLHSLEYNPCVKRLLPSHQVEDANLLLSLRCTVVFFLEHMSIFCQIDVQFSVIASNPFLYCHMIFIMWSAFILASSLSRHLVSLITLPSSLLRTGHEPKTAKCRLT